MNKKALLPLIGLFLLVTGIVLPGSAYAQISEGGTPTSFKYQNTLKSDLPTVQIPINFSVEDLKTVDRWQVSQGAPLKVGVLLPTDLTIDNAGSWNTLPDGKRVWRLQVQAKDAIALMLSFRDFYIPENGKLFIYSSDKTHLIGAFTHHTNPPTKDHPSGDYMKISTFNKVARTSTWYGIDNIKGAPNAHWNVVFEQTANGHAVTEGGSSGSPLFNQNKQIVGTLSGGSSSCEKPNGANTYGKLYYHWDQYPNKDNTSRMDIYLDPNHTGKTQLAGRYATAPKAMPTDLTSVYQNGEVLLKWKAPVSASEKPEQYNVYRNNILIGRTFSTSYIDKEPETGIQSYSVSASYTDNKESAVATTSIYVYELKIPTDVTTSTDGKNILVKWKEPIYQQMIYWGNGTAYLSLGFKQPFYFGQRWNKEDLKPLHGHLVESVSFIPTSGSSYTLNIIQGKRKYVQKLTNLPFDKLIEIPLKEPFVIDASQELIIAFHAEAKLSTAYPAVMDEGPAVNGKGNLISFDGETWEYLYEPSENENENYDFNFFLAATVSSKTKDIPTIKTASNDTTLLSKSSAMPILTRISEVGSSLRSSQASAFPTITGYNIYRNGSKIGNVPNKFITQYIDKQAPTGSILYQVSTLYGKDESKKADADKEVNVGNEKIILSETTISPTVFTDQVELFGNEKVDLLEVITLDGKTVIRQKNPGKIVYTGSLSSGIYIFRIHTDGKAKTMKAQKIN